MKLSILPGSVVLKGKKKFSIHLNFTPRGVGTQNRWFHKERKQLRCGSNYITIIINSTQVEMNK